MTDTPEQRVAAALHAIACTEVGCIGPERSELHHAFYGSRALSFLAADPTLAADLALAAAVRRLDATDIGWSIIHNPGDPLWYVDIADGRGAAESTVLAAITAALRGDR